MARLPQDFYKRRTTVVAKALLGQVLCYRAKPQKILRGRIVEVEAYLGIEDPACHTFGGRKTTRVQSMYLEGGHSYIYMIYGIHFCLNVVTLTEKFPEAVLIRALEPLEPLNLALNGPGKLCKGFGLSKKQDGLALFDDHSPLWIEGGTARASQIIKAPRIGVDYAGEAAKWPLRFLIKGNPHVSRKP